SGEANKLNRDGITKFDSFGSERYAHEELVAEITSAMMSCHLAGKDEDVDSFIKEHEKNHLAYVASWKKAIKENPDYLLSAVKEAETATNFLELNGDLMSLDEYNDKQRKNQMVESGMENESKYFSKQWLNIAESNTTPDFDLEAERKEEPEVNTDLEF
ncbi:MAG: zincin-like metallopeptidase domain-containing protein, partial [Erysipelotrichaceae bacterium]|nr:zincin-like metallopeptidase domain-containing protein [Erysipelotrichaceae bacterium]